MFSHWTVKERAKTLVQSGSGPKLIWLKKQTSKYIQKTSIKSVKIILVQVFFVNSYVNAKKFLSALFLNKSF